MQIGFNPITDLGWKFEYFVQHDCIGEGLEGGNSNLLCAQFSIKCLLCGTNVNAIVVRLGRWVDLGCFSWEICAKRVLSLSYNVMNSAGANQLVPFEDFRDIGKHYGT